MKILIIGSQGFIGQHCHIYFKSLQNEVFTADISESHELNHVVLDKSNTDFELLFKNQSYDLCINATGSANVAFSFEHPFTDFNLNVSNVSKILDAIYKHNPECKFVNLSSAAVYGNPNYLPIDEKHTTHPISPYGFHKLQSEQLLYEYSKFFGLKTLSLRIFSAYGEGLAKQLFWDLYKKTKKSKPIELFGTGNETRDFIYIKDLVRAIQILTKNSDFNGESVNVANGIAVPIGEAAHTFLQLHGTGFNIKFLGNLKQGDPSQWQADITVLKNFGYEPEFTLEQGLTNYVQWLKSIE
jgi:dTDP-glucose 4,6-dehydratase/UDP-glucose 4-epimerase